MNAILEFVLKHGYAFLFAGTFAHQVGIPVPGPLILVCAGALVAAGKLAVLPVLCITVVASVLADWIWFEASRRRGDKVLHFLHCLASRDPEFHDRRAKRIFARYGPALLLVAKFIPGLDAVAPPLAAIARTSRVRFWALDAVGSGLYVCAYGGLGYLFRNDLDRAANYVSRAGGLLIGLALAAICVYIVYRLVQRHRLYRQSQLTQTVPVDLVQYGDLVEIVEGPKNGD